MFFDGFRYFWAQLPVRSGRSRAGDDGLSGIHRPRDLGRYPAPRMRLLIERGLNGEMDTFYQRVRELSDILSPEVLLEPQNRLAVHFLRVLGQTMTA
jgi:hypothetical protein